MIWYKSPTGVPDLKDTGRMVEPSWLKRPMRSCEPFPVYAMKLLSHIEAGSIWEDIVACQIGPPAADNRSRFGNSIRTTVSMKEKRRKRKAQCQLQYTKVAYSVEDSLGPLQTVRIPQPALILPKHCPTSATIIVQYYSTRNTYVLRSMWKTYRSRGQSKTNPNPPLSSGDQQGGHQLFSIQYGTQSNVKR